MILPGKLVNKLDATVTPHRRTRSGDTPKETIPDPPLGFGILTQTSDRQAVAMALGLAD